LNVSLKRLLAIGEFGELHAGMTIEEVRRLLGEPDAWGGTSRKYRHASLYLYRAVEFWFERRAPRGLISIYWEAGETGEFRPPERCMVEDWDLAPGMSFEQVERYLNEQGFRFDDAGSWSPPQPRDLVLPSGLRISFDEDGKLYSVYAPAPGNHQVSAGL
jgi:hypothetical protein